MTVKEDDSAQESVGDKECWLMMGLYEDITWMYCFFQNSRNTNRK